ncbi:MAG: EAL and HDOD domain-containing protein [Bacillota bacterium]
MDIYIARQPIFDDSYDVLGYELLYRKDNVNKYDLNTPDNVATSILLLNTYLNFGLETLVGNQRAFINFGNNLIKNSVIDLLDSKKIVIEILETVEINRRLFSRLKFLKSKGYIFAIDDLMKSDLRDNLYNLIDLCTIVKIDFLGNSKKEILELANYWDEKGKTLLAEKVETKEMYNWAKDNGFKYFQGYYFSKPEMVKTKQLNDSAVKYLNLMKELSSDDPNIQKINNLMEGDTSLTYKLLKMVNAHSEIGHEISSIKHAIMMIGLRNFQTWLTLIMVQDMNYFDIHELVRNALTRMHFLKNIAKDLKRDQKVIDELSLLGTLSVIDGILNMDMKEVVKKIPLDKELKYTLLKKETKYSKLYNLCIYYEKGQFDKVSNISKEFDYSGKKLSERYIESINFANDIFEKLKNNDF